MVCDRRSYEDGVLYVYDRWLFCTPIVPSTEVVGLMDLRSPLSLPERWPGGKRLSISIVHLAMID